MRAKSYGIFELSLDGGKSFTKKANMLLTGFYTTLTGNTFCRVGEGTSPVNFNDSAITLPLTSAAGTLISTVQTYDASTDEIVIKSQYEFTFATGVVKNLSEIGIVLGSTLVSRAVFDSIIEVTAIDVLLVRYTLTTRIDASPTPVVITIGDIDYSGTVVICNPNKWLQPSFGSLKFSDTYVELINGTYVRGSDCYLSGAGTKVVGYAAAVTEASVAGAKIASATVSSGLESTEQTFNVLAVSKADSSVANQMLALIVFDSPVTRTVDDIVNASLTVQQVSA